MTQQALPNKQQKPKTTLYLFDETNIIENYSKQERLKLCKNVIQIMEDVKTSTIDKIFGEVVKIPLSKFVSIDKI